MPPLSWIALALAGSAFVAWLVHLWLNPHLRSRRREALASAPFPPEWDSLLRSKMAIYRDLPNDLRRRLQAHIQVLLHEKRFEPCGGLEEVTMEMRLLVLAQAALLLVGRKNQEFFPALHSILMYPRAYRDSGRRWFSLPEFDEPDTRLGESWDSGSVILSWKSVRHGAAGRHDGLNVVLHEFAHQLDQVDGVADGAPELEEPEDYGVWSRVFQHRYDELLDHLEAGRPSVLDEYGATNPAEFFAVATETFFERPRRLEREMPDLYAELSAFYGLDPASWRSS